MSAAHSPSSSSLVASPAVATKRRRAHHRAASRGSDSRAAGAIAAAVEPLERRVCLSVSFSAAVNWPTGVAPRDVAVGDFNGDGKQDLVTSNGTGAGGSFSVLLGNGAGGFGAPTTTIVTSALPSVAVDDFNGDGHQDLAFVENALDRVLVYTNNGSGGFSLPMLLPVGDGPGSIATGDFDGNGSPDIAVANGISEDVSILLGDGSGFGAAHHIPVGNALTSLTVADFNRDGHPDLVGCAGSFGDSVAVLIGDGSGNFGAVTVPVGQFPQSVAVGDFNGDGKQDIVAGLGSLNGARVGVLLGNGSGGFAAPLFFAPGGLNSFVAVGDFNGDGHADVASADFGIHMLLGDGTGSLAAPLDFPAGNTMFSTIAADLNDDGRQDLAALNFGADSVTVLLNTTLAVPSLTNVAVTSSVLENGIATLTGDIGHPDPNRSFTLSVDWEDGTVSEFVYPAGTTSFSETHQYLDDRPGAASDTFVLELILTDDLGIGTVALKSLVVANVAPETTLAGAGSAVRGVPLAFNGTFTDVGTLDTHEVMWDFGDGTTIAFHPTTDPGALTPTHVYAANGNYIVTMTVRDDDTGTTATPTSVFVSAVGLIDDPSDPGTSMLVVGGTAGDDDIRFSRVNKSSNIDAFIGAQYLGRFNPTSRLVVFAGAGNDTVAMDKNISLSAILLGGDGDDVLTGGNGRDVLIGGTGADRLNGGGDDDILIAGTTAHDGSVLGLGNIMNEWTSSLSLASRVNNLKTGGGLSAGFALNASTVFDDAANDVLSGGSGKDWFLFGNGDVLTDLSNQDAATFV